MEVKNYVEEKNLKNSPKAISINQVDIISSKAKENMCKIYFSEEGTGTGFFCNIPNGPNSWNSLKVLITNYHILNENDKSIDKIIKLSLNNEKKFYEIYIDKFRKVYSNYTYDITIIELKEQDIIDKISFFDIDDRIFREDFKDLFINEKIFLLHYPQGSEMKYSDGFLTNIEEDNFSIRHSCDSSPGSSGGPIINSIDYRVIAIHKGGHKKFNYNLGTFLKVPLEDFNNKFDILPKVEYNKNNKTIDNFLNPQETKKKEYKIEIEDLKSKISAFDKIYFIFAPEVNLNSKTFHSPLCCCFSLSIETLTIIHFVYFAIGFLIVNGMNIKVTKDLFFILLGLLSPIFLFISSKNHNCGFARFSLYFSEFYSFWLILNVKKDLLILIKNAIFTNSEEYCKNGDLDSCFYMFIGFFLGLILGLQFFFDQFHFIYLAYYQLSLIKHKNSQKLE